MQIFNLQESQAYNLGGYACSYSNVAVDANTAAPLPEIKMINDYEWQRRALSDREQHPERYRAKGEDVDATIERIKQWLATHPNT